MTTKTFEVRDRATFIPVLAIRMDPADERDRYLLARVGYGRHASTQEGYVLLTRLEGCETHYDPHEWDATRTMTQAHLWILEHFAELENGAVIDVEYILGETRVAKVSEAL